MADRIELSIEVDDSELQEAQKEVETFEKESERIIEKVDKETAISFNRVLNMARSSYLIGLGMVKATGASVSYFFRAMISSAFATAAVLKPLITAKAMTTGDWISAGISFASLATSIGAAVAAQSEQQELARGLRGVDMTLLGIQQLIGGYTNW